MASSPPKISEALREGLAYVARRFDLIGALFEPQGKRNQLPIRGLAAFRSKACGAAGESGFPP
jgi:hypothetical protein